MKSIVSLRESALSANALALARNVAVAAGGYLLKNLHSPRKRIGYKTTRNNLVTAMDRASEDMIVRAILKKFPGHGIVAEERGRARMDSEYRWIIDPLDGTTNYAHGFPVFAVSVALEIRGRLEMGCVYYPAMKELFWALRGDGAFCNGRRLQVSRAARLRDSMLVTGFPYDIHTSRDNNLNYFLAFLKYGRTVRRAGSACVDLCYVAAGIFDGFWEIKLGPWDLAAAAVIAREAGARLSGMRGEPFDIYSGNIVAANARIHPQMVKVIGTAIRRGTMPLS